jgi:hypothetical protein
MFDKEPKLAGTPLIDKDHPELDLSHELDKLGIKQYQAMFGAQKLLITLGRFDIQHAVVTLRGFRMSPK